jgi:hypothetical protein
MGNRGALHGAGETILRPWKLKAWIACRLEFKDRHRPVMPPNRWTALFFLDEATALAAGHRPCFECRREDAVRFKAAWLAGQQRNDNPPIIAVDNVLHPERIAKGRKITWRARLADLPDGAMIERNGVALLWWRDRLRPWSFAGYGAPFASSGEVNVLTPRSIVAAIAAGYAPALHPSASA